MSMPDMINAGFEIGAGFAVLHHCWCLHRDREVRGVSVLAVAFFTLWGIWNVFWYPWLNQVFSFVAGIFVTLANVLYASMLSYYRKKAVQP